MYVTITVTVCHHYCHCVSPLLLLCVTISHCVSPLLSLCVTFTTIQQVEQLSSWRAHVAEVVSIEYIPYDDSALVLTASADCTTRLWTITGNYIGTFGQVREGRVISTHITSNCYTTGATLEHQGSTNISTSTVSHPAVTV